jgi:prepilin-type N-terminal cleavage/methylation domain-containing protein
MEKTIRISSFQKRGPTTSSLTWQVVRKKPTKGFSLMEVLVGISILGIVYATLFSLMTTSLRNIDRIGEREKMVRLGQMKLNELVLNTNQGMVDSGLAGRFDDKYSWEARIDTVESGENAQTPPPYQVARIRLAVKWPGNSQQNQYALETRTWIPIPDRERP